jgi:hypothetical protein
MVGAPGVTPPAESVGLTVTKSVAEDWLEGEYAESVTL